MSLAVPALESSMDTAPPELKCPETPQVEPTVMPAKLVKQFQSVSPLVATVILPSPASNLLGLSFKQPESRRHEQCQHGAYGRARRPEHEAPAAQRAEL